MTVKAAKRRMPDSYFALIQEFPLAPIRNDAQLTAAQEMIDRLLTRRLDRGARSYLDVLTDLVERYEEEHVPIPDAPEADVLRELMRANGLTQSKLAGVVGISQSTISAVINGSRSLTKEQIVKLAKFFRVAPAAFLPA